MSARRLLTPGVPRCGNKVIMVKLNFVDMTNQPDSKRPIGVFSSIAAGFDRIAANPLLILPPLLLDILLWFGPHIVSPSIFKGYADLLMVPTGTDPDLVQAMIAAVEEFGRRLNVLVALNSFPVGIPSLMSSRLPLLNPLGTPLLYIIQEPGTMLLLAIAAGILGLVLGVIFHRWVAGRVAPNGEVGSLVPSTAAILLLALIGYLGGLFLATGLFLVASMLSLLLPVLGALFLFGGFSVGVWLLIYCMFTPHGIILYRLNLRQAVTESIRTVRLNTTSTLMFVVITLAITWLGNQVWMLPGEDSWYSVLGIVGHAFTSSMLLAASYVFFQDRRAWAQRASAFLASQFGGRGKTRADSEPGDRYEGE